MNGMDNAESPKVSIAAPFDLTGWLDEPNRASQDVRRQGFALLSATGVAATARAATQDIVDLAPAWEDLPADEHLRDGGRYRFRRHGSYVLATTGALTRVAHRAHWQPREYNALHGGIERWFAPLEPALDASNAWNGLIAGVGALFSAVAGTRPWYVEAHQFRIDTASGIGRPTPEGAHRDGVDFVAVIIVSRYLIKGGETRVFEEQGNRGVRFTIEAPWSALLLDDHRVVHETTPIQPAATAAGHRDTLVLTYRAKGFLDAQV